MAAFPFFRLPVELRRHVLLHTDLVTPCRHVVFGRGKLMAVHGPTLETPRMERVAQNRKDADAANAVPHNGDHWNPDWTPPTALFLVSRAFATLAQSVLLSENHIEAAASGLSEEEEERLMETDDAAAWDEALYRDAATCQAAIFVSSIVRCEVLSSLHSLEISFPRAHGGDKSQPSGAVLQWREAARRFSKTLNPRRLIMHVQGDESTTILETVFGKHPLGFRQENLEREDILDLARRSIDMYWPSDRLARLDGVRMFLWDVDLGVEGHKLVYYCRHASEKLPRMAGDMDLFEPLPSAIFCTQRGYQHLSGSVDERESEGWVEGMLVRPGDEDPRWTEHFRQRDGRS